MSLFNISPQGKWAILINNEKTEIGQTYSFPKTPIAWQPKQIYRTEKRLRLVQDRSNRKTSQPTAVGWENFYRYNHTRINEISLSVSTGF
ncbi:MAG: hypothetical protein VSS75_033405, partial [Candidatus Parabeggiatoa sp.]|nr:hypothetical protein [Candidatus Parabeggiatoa sp.]